MVKHIIEVAGRQKDVTSTWTTEPRMFGKVSYMEGTHTFDTGRFATTSTLPITWIFTDAANTKHFITIERSDDQLTMVFPASSQILWHGDERDRTGLYAQTCVAKATFSYQESSFFHSHGIRVEIEGYKLDEMRCLASDTDSWKSAVDMFVKGTEGVKDVGDAVAAVHVKDNRGPMKEWNIDALTSLQGPLKLNVLLNTGLDDKLQKAQGGFMDRGEAQAVLSKPDNAAQMGELIRILLGKTNADFEIFCTMLRKSNNTTWADQLEKKAKEFKEES